jgi:FAD/FMN-containing dehydrogenase
MIALRTPSHAEAALRHFQDQLSAEGFEGELVRDVGARLVAATVNSIYQVAPEAVLYPRTSADLNRCVRAARHAKITLSPRGGGTGTNGQSLTRGVMVDLSRHLNRIRSLDVGGRRLP